MKAIIFVAWLLACLVVYCPAAEKKILVFHEKTGAQVTIHRFEILQQPDGVRVTLSTREDQSEIVQIFSLNSALETLAWSYSEAAKNTVVSAKRDGKFILLTGKHKGEPIEKKFKTKNLPWNQFFNMGLEPFVRSNLKKTKFRAIGTRGPGDMKITSFTAKRQKKSEIIKIMGQDVATVHIKISLSGLLSMFWSGHYWYRKSDGAFVRYRGKNGPGKPVSVMELTEVKTATQ
jgi:hypothetical protein